MNENQAIDALGALAHEIRLKIVRHFVTCGDESCCSTNPEKTSAPISSSIKIVTARLK
jgi:hypothetical protein